MTNLKTLFKEQDERAVEMIVNHFRGNFTMYSEGILEVVAGFRQEILEVYESEIKRIIRAIEDYRTLNKGNAQNRQYMQHIIADLKSLLEKK